MGKALRGASALAGPATGCGEAAAGAETGGAGAGAALAGGAGGTLPGELPPSGTRSRCIAADNILLNSTFDPKNTTLIHD